jgi:hypothetical protein
MTTNKFLTILNGIKTLTTAISESSGVANANTLVATGSDGRIGNSLLPSGIGAATEIMVASENLSAGDFINIWLDSATRKARKADASNNRPANGFVLSAVALNASATVILQGINNQLTGIAIGTIYYLSGTTPGKPTDTAPTTTGTIIQNLGYPVSTTGINFEYDTPIVNG